MTKAIPAGNSAMKDGSILQENSTHKAVLNGEMIDIFSKGFDVEESAPGAADDLHYKDELLYSIPADQSDDLLSIFDAFDETNRCNVADANDIFKDLTPQQLDKIIAWGEEQPVPPHGQQPPVITEEHEMINAADPDVIAAREDQEDDRDDDDSLSDHYLDAELENKSHTEQNF